MPTRVYAAGAKTLNFQARLLGSTGNIVADGTYNVEFKLYKSTSANASAQGVCAGGVTDDCLWLETRTGGSKVTVKAGYISVYLGDVSDLPANIWNQQLWLTMNIGGTAAGPTWDGEMSPRLRLTAVPAAYSLTNYNPATTFSSTLTLGAATGGDQNFTVPDQGAAGSYTLLTSQSANTSFIQNQNASDQTADFRISGTGRANTGLQSPNLERATSGTLSLGTTSMTTALTLGSTNLSGTLGLDSGASSTISIGTSASARTINVGNVAAVQTITVGSTNGTSTLTLQSGTGNASGDINIGDTTVAGKIIDIGSVTNSGTSTIRVGTDTGATQTIQIGSTSASSTIAINGGTGASAVTIQSGGGGTLNLGDVTQTNVIDIGGVTNNGVDTINIATNNLSQDTIAVGNNNSATTVTLQGGVYGLSVTDTGIGIDNASPNADLSFGVGARTINVAAQIAANTMGSNLTVVSGQGNGTGAGGSLILNAAAGGSTGAGGQTIVSGGTSGGGTAAGGALTLQGGAAGAASTGSASGSATLRTQDGATGSGATSGGVAGAVVIQGGNGGAGTGTNSVGGAGSALSLTAGNGGASTGTAANTNGGNITLQAGTAGTGGSGAAGTGGKIIQNATTIDLNSTAGTNFFRFNSASNTIITGQTALGQLTCGQTLNNACAIVGGADLLLGFTGANAGVTVVSASGSIDAFKVVNTSNNEVLTVDTTNNQVILGKVGASGVTGKLVFNNATNSNTSTIQSGTTTTSYALTLPVALGASGDCLKDTNGSGALGFGTCAAGSATLQDTYNADADSSEAVISLTSTDGSLGIRNPASGGTASGYTLLVEQLSTGATDGLRVASAGTGALFKVTDMTATAQDVFTIADGGATTFRNQTNSATAFQIQNATAAEILLTVNTLTRTGGVAGNVLKIGNSTGTDADLTVLQLDGTTANPTTNLSSLNGGLYYNATTNKVMLIENGIAKELCNKTDLACSAGGGSSRVILVPEFPGSTFTPDGTNNNGTLTSDFCSKTNGAVTDINTSICATAGDKHNYYSWTSASGDNDYDIYIRYQLSKNFDRASSTINVYGWRTDATNNDVSVSVYNESGALCGTATSVATGTATWTETAIANITSDTDCSMTVDSVIIFKIRLVASAAEYARVGEIRIDY